MPHSLLKTRKIILVEIELVDEHIQVSSLITEIHTDTGSVIDNDKGKNGRKSEGAGMNAFEIGDASQERNHKTRVGAWHVTVGKGIFNVKSVLVGVERKLDELSDDTNRDRDEENQVRLYEFHRCRSKD